jgi:hypothetical protein
MTGSVIRPDSGKSASIVKSPLEKSDVTRRKEKNHANRTQITGG